MASQGGRWGSLEGTLMSSTGVGRPPAPGMTVEQPFGLEEGGVDPPDSFLARSKCTGVLLRVVMPGPWCDLDPNCRTRLWSPTRPSLGGDPRLASSVPLFASLRAAASTPKPSPFPKTTRRPECPLLGEQKVTLLLCPLALCFASLKTPAVCQAGVKSPEVGKKVDVRGAFFALPAFPVGRAVLGLCLPPSRTAH